MSQHTHKSDENEQADLMKESDYIVLGYVRVPLLHLITKNNGIDGDFVSITEKALMEAKGVKSISLKQILTNK
jgi:hypothetical protein